MKDSRHSAIANNTIICTDAHTERGGITIGPFGQSGARPQHIKVTGNVITGSASWGMDINKAERLSVVGNSVYENDGGGVHIRSTRNTTVVGNLIADNGTSTTPAAGIVVENDGSRYSERNTFGMNACLDTGVGKQSYGIEITDQLDNKNTLIGNTAEGHVMGSWSVAGRENQRSGNYPAMPLNSGTVSLAAGGSQTVWTNEFEVGYPDLHIMAVSGSGEVQTFATTDGSGNTQYGLTETSGGSSVDVDWAVFP